MLLLCQKLWKNCKLSETIDVPSGCCEVKTLQNQGCPNYYRPQRSCGQGNVFTGVCLSTGGEGVCLSAYWDAIPPRMENPPGWRTTTPPEWRTPPGWRTHPPRWRTPPSTPLPPGWRTTTPPGWRTPPGSRLQHTVYERPVRILMECILVWKLVLSILNLINLKSFLIL